ncbi:MAG: hypothetical protein KJ556_02060 [Gammaproteobacteria bacterium]|nr:hypothetical protein [Gammaproteobacteria bacterium]MBU2058044.1 hypothetical protein [Gammaproteobacteria bacterium]MBU2173892.1 hypothetical protein [Gammaproteobacteria bacterium]MBU2245221.1 hypothetical protein [Gammaproteobacteria bacterium]MBU2343928.1 hypothetical protein [Gammaproteobacteria bacterium]
MKTIVGISNFSFKEHHFNSLSAIEGAFDELKKFRKLFKQASLDFCMGRDIAENKYYGLSLLEQVNNITLGDRGLEGLFRSKLHQIYFRFFNINYTTDELIARASDPISEHSAANFILYVPSIDFYRDASTFKNADGLCAHYEDILGKYPVDSDSYYQRLITHFDKLMYHPNCRDSLDNVEGGFYNYSIAFTECIKALNDLSPTKIATTKERLSNIRAKTNYECTEEGKSSTKFNFTFSHDGRELSLTCQFHMKPSKSNNPGDTSYYQKRIYFGFFPLEDQEWRIAVASIGPHL